MLTYLLFLESQTLKGECRWGGRQNDLMLICKYCWFSRGRKLIPEASCFLIIPQGHSRTSIKCLNTGDENLTSASTECVQLPALSIPKCILKSSLFGLAERFFFNVFGQAYRILVLDQDQTCTLQWKPAGLNHRDCQGRPGLLRKTLKKLGFFSSYWHPRLGNLAFRDPCCWLSPWYPSISAFVFWMPLLLIFTYTSLWRESFGKTKIIGLRESWAAELRFKWIEKIIFLQIMFLFWNLA